MTIRRGLGVGVAVLAATSLLAMTWLALMLAAPLAQARDKKDCSDFKNQKAAQRWFHHHHPHKDPSGLDADNDGIACEDNPCPCSHHPWVNASVVRVTLPRAVASRD